MPNETHFDIPRESLAALAGAAVAERVKNDKLAGIAGEVVARLVAGEHLSHRDVANLAFAALLNRKKTF